MNNLKFTVDSALLSELGEKLVESVHVALVELIKNAYDADATKVTVQFAANSSGGQDLKITDDGVGMTYEDVKRFWMRIATTNKVENPLSRLFGRPKTGAKGIGRFCCRRLGTELALQTVARLKSDGLQQTKVSFPWAKFKRGTEVTQIECLGEIKELKQARTGTTLVIKGSAKNEWKARGYDYLKRQLSLLVVNRGAKRRGYKEDPGFNIILHAPGTTATTKNLREEVINAGWGTLTANVDAKGKARYLLDALGIGEKQITSEDTYPSLAGISLRIGIIADVKEHFRKPKLLSKANVRQIEKDWGGIQIRYNGFRVYPYGNDDWLSIDHDRALSKGAASGNLVEVANKLKIVAPGRALLSMLSMRSYLGEVEISSKVKGFELKANREGFLDSPEIRDLKKFVRYGIDWSSIYRDYFLRLKGKKKTDQARQELVKISGQDIESEKVVEKAVNYIQTEVENVANLLPPESKSEFKKIIKTVGTATDAILKHDSSNKQELHHLRLIASTSTLLLIFSHEVKSLLGMLDAASATLKGLSPKLNPKIMQGVEEVIRELKDSKDRFSELIDMTSLVGVDSKNAKEQRLSLKEHAIRAIKCFDLVINRYDISINAEDIPDNILVGPMLEAELYAILLNILSNSIKAVIAGGSEKEIHLAAKNEKDYVRMEIKDTGVGLNESNFTEVFTPFIADPSNRLYKNLNKRINPEDRFFVGTGSGLGLSIVKEIIQIHKGTIEFKKTKGKWKSNLEVILP
ncbi:ATP-binding protein [Candidatus Margulisiibacteriota bacterium]